MKRCPNCQKTYDDAMRFCQTDGTPLVDDAPVDPYKTMVARPEDIAAAIPPAGTENHAPPESVAPKSEPSIPIAPPANDEILDIPAQSDPLKTMFASEEEIRREMAARDAEDQKVIDIPPLSEEPSKPAAGDLAPPPHPPASPFDTPPPASPFTAAQEDTGFPKTSPPIPSPFSGAKREFADPVGGAPPPQVENPAFVEPEPVANVPAANPFQTPSSPPVQSSWTPPAQQQFGQPTPVSPGRAGGPTGPSSILAIISLLLGIVGLIIAVPSIIFTICSSITFLFGIAAAITGFLGRSRAAKSPKEYGGKGLATFGLILGILDILIPFVIVGFWLLLWGGLAALGNLS